VGRAATGIGDRHLSAVLRVSNAASSGGVGFVLDVNTPADLTRAIAGCGYFGLTDMAELIAAIARTPPDDVEDLYQDEWDSLDDGELDEAFRRRFEASPEDFDALQEDD
jgi:hypothetical protein